MRLHRNAWRKKQEHTAKMSPNNYYGWFDNETLLGVCRFIVHADKVEITNISVAEDARNRGVGSAMISSLKKCIS
jgi:ribosomal protein S18 acetylase RimI-like enzyme